MIKYQQNFVPSFGNPVLFYKKYWVAIAFMQIFLEKSQNFAKIYQFDY